MSKERLHTHFADDETLKRLASLERENANLRGKNHTTLNDYREEVRMREEAEEENTELRKDKERLVEAATLGLEYVREVLAEKRQSLAGYPDRYAREEADEAMINQVIDAAMHDESTTESGDNSQEVAR